MHMLLRRIIRCENACQSASKEHEMPYIPERHMKYELLPYCREYDDAVFSYPQMLDKCLASD